MKTAIEKIQAHAQAIAAGEVEKVRPGMPVAFTAACVPGDCIRQGDLYLVVVDVSDAMPRDYVLVKKPRARDKQLVPGNTQGARHCLDSLAGVTLYQPAKWSEESLQGPIISTTEERRVLHPTHGAVTIPAGLAVQCFYQREWSREEAKERRARD